MCGINIVKNFSSIDEAIKNGLFKEFFCNTEGGRGLTFKSYINSIEIEGFEIFFGTFHKRFILNIVRDTRFYPLFVQKWCFSCWERDFSIYFFASTFLFGANFQKSFQIYQFQIFHIHKNWRRPLLYQVYIKAVHILTIWTQTKWSQALWLTNDKALYVAKEDSICLLRVAKDKTLNKQWIKCGVPLGVMGNSIFFPFCDQNLIEPTRVP